MISYNNRPTTRPMFVELTPDLFEGVTAMVHLDVDGAPSLSRTLYFGPSRFPNGLPKIGDTIEDGGLLGQVIESSSDEGGMTTLVVGAPLKPAGYRGLYLWRPSNHPQN